MGQMLEKRYVSLSQDMPWIIIDPSGYELMTVKAQDKSFSIERKPTTMHAYTNVETTFCGIKCSVSSAILLWKRCT